MCRLFCRPHRPVLVLLLAFTVAPTFLAAQDVAEGKLLIRNVLLVDLAGETDDIVASLLLDGGRLSLVTKDPVPASEADEVRDAQGGVLLGKLVLGELAAFIILDDDPRENVEILLDTATHARFAVARGEILRNSLPLVADAETEPEKRRWLAYTPPPFILPLSYTDSRKWNRFETKAISGIFVGMVLMDRQRWGSQDRESESQVGDLDEFSRAEIRGLRVGLVGTLNFKRPWVYTIFGATTAFDAGFDAVKDDDFTMYDYRLDIPLFENVGLSIGKQKEPISMERLTGGLFLPVFERSSVSDALLRSRNVGIVLNGMARHQRLTWALGGFNDWFDADEEYDESSQQVVARLTVLPFVSEDSSNLFHLGLGIRYSDAERGLRYRSKPEYNLAPLFVDTSFDSTGTETGVFGADNSLTYALEVSWRRGPFWLHSEFLRNEIEAPALGNPVLGGYHVGASWIFTGEMRPYNRRGAVFRPVPVARPVYGGGGWGAWELGLRFSDVDLTDGLIEGGEMKTLAASLNWFLTPYFIVEAQYRHIELDRFGLVGTSDGILTRLVLVLE